MPVPVHVPVPCHVPLPVPLGMLIATVGQGLLPTKRSSGEAAAKVGSVFMIAFRIIQGLCSGGEISGVSVSLAEYGTTDCIGVCPGVPVAAPPRPRSGQTVGGGQWVVEAECRMRGGAAVGAYGRASKWRKVSVVGAFGRWERTVAPVRRGGGYSMSRTRDLSDIPLRRPRALEIPEDTCPTGPHRRRMRAAASTCNISVT